MAGSTDIDAVDLDGEDSFVLQTRGDAVIQEETPAYGNQTSAENYETR